MRSFGLIRSLWAMATALLMMLAFPSVSRGGEDPGGNDNQAPEFDIGTAGAAFSLLAGSFLVLRARRHRRKTG
jgi:hypothetical protein